MSFLSAPVTRFSTIVLFILLMSLPSFAANCGVGKVILQDNFTLLSPVWGLTPGPDFVTGPDGLVVTMKPKAFLFGLNQSGFFGDYEVCMTVKINYKCTDPKNCEASPTVGLTFWGEDKFNYYVCDITPPYLSYSVSRLQKNKTLTLVHTAYLPENAIPKMMQDFIDVSVAVKGNHMICKVNGIVAAELDGLPPDGGSLFGFQLYSSDEDTEGSKFVVKKIEVRELQ